MTKNKEIVLKLYTAFDRGEFDLVRSMMSEDFTTDLVGIPPPLNREALWGVSKTSQSRQKVI